MMISIDEINNLTKEFNIDKKKIDNLFEIIENDGKGNRLFYSLSQIFTESNSQKKHNELRKKVCDFYKKFNLNTPYNIDSVEEKIQLLLLTDNEHKKNICKGGKNPEWGTLVDIYAISSIFNVNVILFNLFRENPSQYLIIPIKSTEAKKNNLFKIQYTE
jgi:hypothetical protein